MRALLLGLVVAFGWPGRAAAGIPPPADAMYFAIEAAGKGLAGGADRAKVLKELTAALTKHGDQKSYYLATAKALAADLEASAKADPKPADPKDVAADPVKHLRETKDPVYLLAYPENWGRRGPRPDEKEPPADPVRRLVRRDRAVIGELIPLLADRTPTRAFQPVLSSFDRPHVPRVCDYALLLIEFHSECVFSETVSASGLLHKFPEADREAVAKRVAEWWAANKNKSVAAGIRDQIGRALPYGQIRMARALIRLGTEGNPDDREFGLGVLREYVRWNPRAYPAVEAGDVLSEAGDRTALDVFRELLEEFADGPGAVPGWSSTIYHQCRHGGRREWESLYVLAWREANRGGDPRPATWVCVVHSGRADKSPYAIPLLGLGVEQAEAVAAAAPDEPVPPADVARAVGHLQTQTGVDFGYKWEGTAEERAAAIKRAQSWWAEKGKAKYTFDFIEENLVKKPPAKKP
ncbi:MAG: hypothetical protein K2X82_11600 [Gemmataceae bacterium]|nr:hypothetical protein [Gemmataceae bacterium]